ncbi:MAG: DUF4058 family protein [Pirellulaceae bacterium]|nr:DUF4058 family protein [Pirellulaceae bacterium]
MPIHDWSRAEAGIFHHFHQRWISELSDRLNGGALPKGFFALLEQSAGGAVPDVLTLERLPPEAGDDSGPGLAVATAPPQTRYVMSADLEIYAARADLISIRHPLGEVVAVLEVVSPGNKSSRHALRAFVEKSLALLSRGVHLLVVDLLPPTKRDPRGIHAAIWEEIQDQEFLPPADKPLTLASYAAGFVKRAYVEPVAVGDVLPTMPLFLSPELHIPTPLEESYMRTWSLCPPPMRELLQPKN